MQLHEVAIQVIPTLGVDGAERTRLAKAAKLLRSPTKRALCMMKIVMRNARFHSPEQALWGAVVTQAILDAVEVGAPAPNIKPGESQGAFAKRVERWKAAKAIVLSRNKEAAATINSTNFRRLCRAAGTDAEYVLDMADAFGIADAMRRGG